MEAALQALYRAIYARLSRPGALWGSRVYADLASANAQRPYVVFFWAGGGEANTRRHADAELLLTVKIISERQAEAFQGVGRLAELLNDAGVYDSADPLDGGPDWVICTMTQERAVHLVELVDGARVYHEGFQLRVVMEAAG